MNREEVQQIFLDFLDEEEDSWRRQRDGLYASYLFGKDERKVKVRTLYSTSLLLHMHILYCYLVDSS